MSSYQNPGFDKALYWQRRHDGVRDQGDAPRHIASALSRGKPPSARARKREQWKAYRRAERKASSRGV